MKYQIVRENIEKLIKETTNGNQDRFAKLIGVNSATVVKWLKGITLPNGRTCIKIKEKCKIPSIDWLLTGEYSNKNITQGYFDFLELNQYPEFQEFIKLFKRYKKLQRRADKKIIVEMFNFNSIQNGIDIFEDEIHRRKAYKVIQGTSSNSSDPEAS